MKYSIVYVSNTGNTRLLAETIRAQLPAEDCIYCGVPCEEAAKADRNYVGFWTDKGGCTAEISDFLKALTTQEVFLFGTAGFGGAPESFEQILKRVAAHIPDSARLAGSYMCQGKMPVSVRQRYEQMRDKPGLPFNVEDMIANFDRALSHPDNGDLQQLKEAVKASLRS